MENSSLFGIILGAGAVTIVCLIVWFILNLVANWKLLSKAGKGGWQSLIPIWNTIARYGVSWSKLAGLITVIGIIACTIISRNSPAQGSALSYINLGCSILVIVLAIIEKFKLSKAYGHGAGFGFGLIFLEPIFIMILAFSRDKYVGKN